MLYYEFEKIFPTERDAILHFINVKYPNGAVCPYCGETYLVYHRNDKNHKVFQCSHCNNSFSILKDTIFGNTQVELRKWFYAMNQMITDRKGLSAKQLQRQIGGSYETSWRMLKLIRQAMGNEEEKELFEAIVEIAETYI